VVGVVSCSFSQTNNRINFLRIIIRSGAHPSVESKTGCSPVTLLKGIHIVDTSWSPYRIYSNGVGERGCSKSKAAYFDEDSDEIFDNEIVPSKCIPPQCGVLLIMHNNGDNCV
jgi:hypothetical protein